MRFSTLVSTASFAASVLASPLSITHSVHEKRDGLPQGWQKRSALDRRAILPMKVALAQSNLEKSWDWLSEVSSPDSENYGKHWTSKEVAEAFAPRCALRLNHDLFGNLL